jgi:hypothetical protein
VPTVLPAGRVFAFAPVAPSSSESVALVSRAPPSSLLA